MSHDIMGVWGSNSALGAKSQEALTTRNPLRVTDTIVDMTSVSENKSQTPEEPHVIAKLQMLAPVLQDKNQHRSRQKRFIFMMETLGHSCT